MNAERYQAEDDFEEYENLGLDALLAATEKNLAVSRGLEDPDDKDASFNDRIYSVDRLMPERFKLDHNKALRSSMGRLARFKTLAPLGPGFLDSYTVDYLKGNPLAPALEEVNPMHILEHKRRITRMGPGGIGDPNAITAGNQAVHASQFGFIDPIAGPESEKSGIDTRLAHGTRLGSDGQIYQLFRNRATGKNEWHSPKSLRGKVLKLPD